MELTKKEINNLSYPDFVAFLEQENTPPGAEYTLQYWMKEAQISLNSFVLDLACTTGFSSRRISQATKRSGFGVDISKLAVIQANAFAKAENVDSINFLHGDATDLPFKTDLFTHVLGGSNFSFIQNREKGLSEVHRVMKTFSFLCISNYYYTTPPSIQLLDEVEKSISFRPSAEWTESYWKNFLSNKFAIFKGEDIQLPVNSDDEIKKFINQQLQACTKKLNPEEYEACFERLFYVRKTLNEQRRIQKIALQIWIKK